MKSIMIIAEDTEILITIMYFLSEFNLIKQDIPTDEISFFKYKFKETIIYTAIGCGSDNVLKFFKSLLYENRKVLERLTIQDNLKAIFIYLDKDSKTKIETFLNQKNENFEYLNENTIKLVNQVKGNCIDLYFIFLGKSCKLFDTKLVEEFESIFIDYEKDEIESNELFRIMLQQQNIIKPSLLFPLKMIILYNEKPNIKTYIKKLEKQQNIINKLKDYLEIELIKQYF